MDFLAPFLATAVKLKSNNPIPQGVVGAKKTSSRFALKNPFGHEPHVDGRASVKGEGETSMASEVIKGSWCKVRKDRLVGTNRSGEI